MNGREFKRLVFARIPDDVLVEMSITEQSPYPEDDEEITVWYEIKDIVESNATKKIWLVEAGRATRG
jgi:hypothetical protein